MLEEALEYASRGWRVFPLLENSKLPATENGVHDATTDEATIRGWFDGRNRNIAIACGDGLIVVDVDLKDGKDGFRALEAAGVSLEDTICQSTPTGGKHFLLSVDGKMPNAVGLFGRESGIDVRADGGYIVAHPSVIDGKPYEWLDEGMTELQAAPEEIVKRLQSRTKGEVSAEPITFDESSLPDLESRVRQAAEYLSECEPAVQGAAGHSSLLAACNALLWGFALKRSIATKLLWEYYNPRCQPPWDETDISDRRDFERKYEQALSYKTHRPLGYMLHEVISDSVDGFLDSLPAEEEGAHESMFASADDLIEDDTPVKWLVKGTLPETGLGMMYAPPSEGKSFVAIDFAARVAAGLSWHGSKTKQGTVVYLAGEGISGMRLRVKAWSQRRNARGYPLYVSKRGGDLDTIEGLHKVVKDIKKLEDTPKLIVVDTLARWQAGDENSTQDASRFVAACDALVDNFKCYVLLIHHSGKDVEKGYRGSSAFKGAVDTEMSLKAEGLTRTLSFIKTKETAKPKPMQWTFKTWVLQDVKDEDGSPVSSCVIEEQEYVEPSVANECGVDMDAVYQFVKNNGPIDQTAFKQQVMKEEFKMTRTQATVVWGELQRIYPDITTSKSGKRGGGTWIGVKGQV